MSSLKVYFTLYTLQLLIFLNFLEGIKIYHLILKGISKMFWLTKLSMKFVCIIKAMVFPVVMYGCEIWTIKKAEHQRTDAFKISVLNS